MSLLICIYICIHVYICRYIHWGNDKKNGEQNYMPGNFKKMFKKVKLFQYFSLLFIYFTSLREETGLPEISSLQEISKRKALWFVCEIFSFCLDPSFHLLCGNTLNLLPWRKFSHLTQEVILTGRLVYFWGCVQGLCQCLRKLTFDIEPQLWWLIPSHEDSQQAPPPATVTCGTGPAATQWATPVGAGWTLRQQEMEARGRS